MLFTEALSDPFRGWVKAHKKITLQDAINRTRDLQDSVPKNKPPQKFTNLLENKEKTIPQKEWLNEDTQRDLRRKNLCFNFKEPWAPNQRCMGKGRVHLIKLLSDSNEEDELEQKQDGELHNTELEQWSQRPTIATLTRVPTFHTIRVMGSIRGQCVIALIDGGATHNFIDASWVERKIFPIEDFEGFTVVMVGNHMMKCTQRIPQLQVQLGNYKLVDELYVVDVPDMSIVLGVQWLYSIGKCSTNYQTLEMEFLAVMSSFN